MVKRMRVAVTVMEWVVTVTVMVVMVRDRVERLGLGRCSVGNRLVASHQVVVVGCSVCSVRAIMM